MPVTATYKLVIPGKIPTLNETIGMLNSRNRNVYNAKKQEVDNAVAWRAKEQLRGVHIDEPFCMVMKWFSKNRGTDCDNIEAGRKYVLDGLQVAGTISKDSWKMTNGGCLHLHEVAEAPNRVRCEIWIMVGGQFKLPPGCD